MKRVTLIILIQILILNVLLSQNRWANTYLDGEDPYSEGILVHYDNGYLLYGKYENTNPLISWLIKTDINGEVLWKKVIGNNDFSVFINEIGIDDFKNLYIAGTTYSYGSDADPIIIKLNPCGEKKWCKVFSEDDFNFSRSLVVNNDNGITVALAYMYWPPYTNRICLSRLDSDGNLLWKKYYNGQDSLIRNSEVESIITTPDNGYLITGSCAYPDPDNPNIGRSKPYYIKTDSDGNFLWERVVHKDVVSPSGEAWNTVISPDSNYFYSSISHHFFNRETKAPALLKMDMNGDVIDIYDITSQTLYGKLFGARFINDTSLMASVFSGYPPKAVVIDTLGKILFQSNMLVNNWTAHTEVSSDNKLLFFLHDRDDDLNYTTYLFKFNNKLQSDTIYSQAFNYDSLCPYPILNDTIIPDNCGIIVGNDEIIFEKEERLFVFPNPASKGFVINSVYLERGGIIQLINIQGQIVYQKEVPLGTATYEVDVTNLTKGVYLIKLRSQLGKEVSAKIVVN